MASFVSVGDLVLTHREHIFYHKFLNNELNQCFNSFNNDLSICRHIRPSLVQYTNKPSIFLIRPNLFIIPGLLVVFNTSDLLFLTSTNSMVCLFCLIKKGKFYRLNYGAVTIALQFYSLLLISVISSVRIKHPGELYSLIQYWPELNSQKEEIILFLIQTDYYTQTLVILPIKKPL